MSERDRKDRGPISRRRFVGLLAAGSAAVLSRSASAQEPVAATPTDDATAPAKPAKKPAAKPVAATLTPTQKEFERQRTSTLATVKTIRDFPLAPGGELGVTFRPMRAARRGR